MPHGVRGQVDLVSIPDRSNRKSPFWILILYTVTSGWSALRAGEFTLKLQPDWFRDNLVRTAHRKCGIKPEQVDVSDAALLFLIENYCREAGVRNLQKQIEFFFRKVHYLALIGFLVRFKNLVYSGSQGKSSLVAAPPAPVDIPGKSLIGAFCYELFPGASSDLLTCRNL
ncbi:hypothetical protein F2Q68_00045798 [Brassica cretica]|uniref:Lon protease AAA+ ATPase lid domain-containing protein n=1 Tax=Brassica cretica TaxID=69181 RepID=A0A8S9LJI1_BRACR|nr:hypothetical protein F2Q68_00045798 [Brassica cretica]